MFILILKKDEKKNTRIELQILNKGFFLKFFFSKFNVLFYAIILWETKA